MDASRFRRLLNNGIQLAIHAITLDSFRGFHNAHSSEWHLQHEASGKGSATGLLYSSSGLNSLPMRERVTGFIRLKLTGAGGKTSGVAAG